MSTEGGVCREARDGACMMYREMGAHEGHLIDGGRRERMIVCRELRE